MVQNRNYTPRPPYNILLIQLNPTGSFRKLIHQVVLSSKWKYLNALSEVEQFFPVFIFLEILS